MQNSQTGIIMPIPKHARYMTFDLLNAAEPDSIRHTLYNLTTLVDGQRLLMGLGAIVVRRLGCSITGLYDFPQELRFNENNASPAALWCWLRGHDRGSLLLMAHELEQVLASSFTLRQVIDAFDYNDGHDLTGYEDGTENPKDEAAVQTAIVEGNVDGLDGSSFVVVQQWVHQWAKFNAMSKRGQDEAFGRERISNDELTDAPDSAHIVRTAQESFEPRAFILRRSMPWADSQRGGLMFVAFGHSFQAFEAQWRRMLGLEDDIQDAILHETVNYSV